MYGSSLLHEDFGENLQGFSLLCQKFCEGKTKQNEVASLCNTDVHFVSFFCVCCCFSFGLVFFKCTCILNDWCSSGMYFKCLVFILSYRYCLCEDVYTVILKLSLGVCFFFVCLFVLNSSVKGNGITCKNWNITC